MLTNQSQSGFDISGTYKSENTGNLAKYLSTRTGDVFSITQENDEISGTFGDQKGKIWGKVEGSIIIFDWVSPQNSGIGKWEANADRSELQGTWTTGTRNYSGTRNLKRIE